jgi:hypothetical protein
MTDTERNIPVDKNEIEKKMREASEAEAKKARPPRADAAGTADSNGAPPGKSGAKPKPAKGEPGGVPDGAIPVHLTLSEMADLVLGELEQKPEPGLLLYGGVPHRIVRREEQGGIRPHIQIHTEDSLRGHVARRVEFVRQGKDERWTPANPPMHLIKDLLTLPEYPPGIPRLDYIKNVPLLTDDGELIATSGLHPEHRVFLSLDSALEGMRLPQKISQKDIERAVAVILDPFVDVPLDEPSSANVIGMLFAMVFRECVGGLTPLFALDANRASAGKGTLASILSAIAYGHEARFSSGNIGSEELEKRLLAQCARGTLFHVLDNVERIVWSPELSAFLTAPMWEGRKLGYSEMCCFPNRMVIALTGNHVRVGGDVARRTVLIRLRDERERPEETPSYTHEPIIPYVLSQRANILRAMYVVLAAWHRGGRLVPKDAPRMGSFQEWVNFSAGILETMGGCADLLGNREEVRGRDSNAEEYALMLRRGRQHFGSAPFLAKELWSVLATEDVPTCVSSGASSGASSGMGSGTGGSAIKRMGRLLVRIEDRAFDDGLTLRAAGEENHTRRYRIESREDRAAAPRVIDNDKEAMED